MDNRPDSITNWQRTLLGWAANHDSEPPDEATDLPIE